MASITAARLSANQRCDKRLARVGTTLLIHGSAQSKRALIMMTSISFYLGWPNRSKVFAHPSRVGKLKTSVGKRIFSKDVCLPWPGTVPAPKRRDTV